MKVLNNLSVKDLKLNKKRSAVIIIGIILSTALICGVAGIVTSFQHTLLKYETERDGDYHATFCNVPKDEVKYIEENRNVKKCYLSEDLGFANFTEGSNKEKPYLNVISMNDGYLKNMGVNLSEGRLPENETEVVISRHIITNGKVDYKIGDTITLDIGTRQLTDGTKLKQDDSYSKNGIDENGKTIQEEIVNTNKKTYKIVGIVERPSSTIEPYSAPGYTIITKMQSIHENVNVSVVYTDVFKYQEFTESINQMVKSNDTNKELKEFAGLNNAKYSDYKYEVQLHTDLLRFEGANLSDNSMKMIYYLAGIVIVIILVSSVFVIRNGFAISITERIKQYGMLSSIGATKKQIRKSVYFEGFVLGIIGIPLGILSGIFAIFFVLKLVNYILMEYIDGTELIYNISWIAIVASALISAITIWLSCKSSAKKASKITPIDAIRSSEDIKLKAKKMKCPKIITKIFKMGGEIAYKNLKRSRKKYRTTVISIIVSIVTFITISSFIDYGFKMSNVYYTEIGYNLSVAIENDKTNVKSQYEKLENISKLEGIEGYTILRTRKLELQNDDNQSEFGKKVKQMQNQDDYYDVDDVKTTLNNKKTKKDNLNIIALGKEEYQKFISKINKKYDECSKGAILIDNCTAYVKENENDKNFKKEQGNLYTWNKGDTVTGNIYEKEDENPKEESIKIIEKTNERPMGLEYQYGSQAYLVVSDEYIEKIGYESIQGLMIKANDSNKVEDEINKYAANLKIPANSISIYNQDEMIKANNAIVLVISIFLYGFIAVITAIGITNIFNTITTNMNLRKKEFAMLKSIGMTKKEFNRMIRLESIFYGMKSLLIGLPIGIIISYFICKAFSTEITMAYVLPFKAIIISIIFVALVIGIIMRYSMSKINKQNIIETIRNDNI